MGIFCVFATHLIVFVIWLFSADLYLRCISLAELLGNSVFWGDYATCGNMKQLTETYTNILHHFNFGRNKL